MIEKFSFGNIVIDGRTFTSDIKIVNGRIVSDWWRRKGHRVDLEDIRDIIEAKPEIVVIGKGSPGMMKTTSEVRNYMENSRIRLIEEKTAKAIDTFNQLTQAGEKVAGGFHLGC